MARASLLLGLIATANASQGYIRAPLDAISHSQLNKRATNSAPAGDELELNSGETGYLLNITIGTPPQPVQLHFDTGSSDLVVVKTGVAPCNGQSGQCAYGSIDPVHSSTYSVISPGGFNISYGDGDSFAGDYATDVIDIGGIHLDAGEVAFGLADHVQSGATHQNDGTGVFGVGYAPQKVGNATSALAAMVASRAINRQAYSLSLGSLNQSASSVMFGGVESSLYDGDLVALPILQNPPLSGTYNKLQVALTGIAVTFNNNSNSSNQLITPDNFAVPALIDSGTSNTELPSDILNTLLSGLGASWIDNNAYIPCSALDSSLNGLSLVYYLGDPSTHNRLSITVPLPNLLTPRQQQNTTTNKISYTANEPACQLALSPLSNPAHLILGDSFMRSAYFVFDLANNQIAVAPAASAATTNSQQQTITAIPTGTSIPGCSSTDTFSQVATDGIAQNNQQAVSTGRTTAGGGVVAASPTFVSGGVAAGAAASGSGSSSGTAASSGTSKPSSGGTVGARSASNHMFALMAVVVSLAVGMVR